jgi:DNA-binding protein HU-beta
VDSIVCHTQREQFVADGPNVVVDAVDPQYRQGRDADVIADAMTSMLEHALSESVTWSCSARTTAETVSALRAGVSSSNTHPKEDFMATKAELIDAVADAAGVSKADAERTLGAFFDHVVAATKKGEKVAWPGFGSFSTTKRSARTGRNPQTGAPVQIKASTAMKFTASSTLKSALNSK